MSTRLAWSFVYVWLIGLTVVYLLMLRDPIGWTLALGLGGRP